MTREYVAAIDQGTTSSRCIVFDAAGSVVAVDQREHRQIFPRPGWVEHDPDGDLAQRAGLCRRGASRGAGLATGDLAAVGITNQRETTLVWDRATGEPVHNAIVWQDTRTHEIVTDLAAKGGAGSLPRAHRPAAGHLLLRRRRCAGCSTTSRLCERRADAGELLFGTMDSWLIWNLTGRHVTDVTNASRTMLMNLSTVDWDDVPAGRVRRPARHAARRSGPPPRSTARPAAPWTACRWPARWATSRRRCSARPVSTRATPSAPTAPGSFLLLNTGATATVSDAQACSPRSATSSTGRRRSTRWRARSR